ncbi:MAG: dipeptide epimerase [Pseudomonadota bacterium]
MSAALKLDIEIIPFELKVPFVITGYRWTTTDTVRVSLTVDSHTGRGEAVGSYYLNETAESMAADLERIAPKISASTTPEALLQLMPACGARNALDCAFWDLRCKQMGRSIWELLQLQPEPLTTVFTIGIETPEVMAERAREAAELTHLKIKLDAEQPVERLEAIRAARPDASLVIDVNQGWSLAELKEYLPHCERLGIAMLEQPLRRGEDALLDGFVSPVPLGADESCLHLGEIDEVIGRYAVLNIKLDKCGGLTEALALVKRAQAANMEIMVGNMTGSSLSMAPAFVIGQYSRFVDIDGPLLFTEDIENGLSYTEGGRVTPPPPLLWG